MVEEYVNEKLRQYRQAELERQDQMYRESGADGQRVSRVGKLSVGIGMLLSLFGIRI